MLQYSFLVVAAGTGPRCRLIRFRLLTPCAPVSPPADKACERGFVRPASPRDAAGCGCARSQTAAGCGRARECACAARSGPSPSSDSRTSPAAAAPAGTNASCSSGIAHGSTGRADAVVPALGLFFEHLLQNVPIQGQIGHQALQACILVSQLPKLAQLAHTQVAVLLLPDVERGFADP